VKHKTLDLSTELITEIRQIGHHREIESFYLIKSVVLCPLFNMTTSIDSFHSRDQQLCKFLGTKGGFVFNCHRIFLVHQHGRCFIVLVHQYGRHDVI